MAFFKNMYNKLLGEEELPKETENVSGENEQSEEVISDETENTEEEKEAVQETKPSKSIELKIARLTAFDMSITDVANHLIGKRPVVLNLEDAPRDAEKRIIDFFSGVAYTIGGQLKSVSSHIYIVTPNNVEVSNDPSYTQAKNEKYIPKNDIQRTSPYEGF